MPNIHRQPRYPIKVIQLASSRHHRNRLDGHHPGPDGTLIPEHSDIRALGHLGIIRQNTIFAVHPIHVPFAQQPGRSWRLSCTDPSPRTKAGTAALKRPSGRQTDAGVHDAQQPSNLQGNGKRRGRGKPLPVKDNHSAITVGRKSDAHSAQVRSRAGLAPKPRADTAL